MRLYNEELHDLYFSPKIIRVFICRRMKWAKHVGEKRKAYRLGNLK
jgi:hypothetical protein